MGDLHEREAAILDRGRTPVTARCKRAAGGGVGLLGPAARRPSWSRRRSCI